MRAGFIALAVLSIPAFRATAGDWPQILGPNRNGAAQNESLADRWPADGPQVEWSKSVGSGFAGVAVSGETAVLFHRQGDDEIVQTYNAATGREGWSTSFDSDYVPSFNPDSGPRATPLIHEDRVYVYGARGTLACLNMTNGSIVWERDTYADFSSKRPSKGEPPEGYFGFASSPILEGDRLLLNIGGKDGAGIVAFNADTGKTLWTTTDEKASYSSPVAATIGGRRHVIFAARLNVVSVDPKDGRVLFSFPFGRLGPAVTAANPTVLGDSVFITGSYNFGAVLAKAGASGIVQQWSSDEIMSSQYTTCVEYKGTLIGIHGRQDVGRAVLRCFEPKTKRILWTEDGFGYATILLADDKLVILKTDGELILAEASTTKYTELASASVFNSTTRALPALSNGRLFVRDRSTLKCLNLK